MGYRQRERVDVRAANPKLIKMRYKAEHILERAEMESVALGERTQTAESSGAFSVAEAALSREVVGALRSTGNFPAGDYVLSEMDVQELEHLYAVCNGFSKGT